MLEETPLSLLTFISIFFFLLKRNFTSKPNCFTQVFWKSKDPYEFLFTSKAVLIHLN